MFADIPSHFIFAKVSLKSDECLSTLSNEVDMKLENLMDRYNEVNYRINVHLFKFYKINQVRYSQLISQRKIVIGKAKLKNGETKMFLAVFELDEQNKLFSLKIY